jgi:L-amino acid N-acyltransferase YncA
MANLIIRPAMPGDVPAIADIFNHYVANSTCTYQTDVESVAARVKWLAGHGPNHPVTVAVSDGQIVAWGSLSAFNYRSAYARTVENTVYVHHQHHRKGIGRAVTVDLIERAKQLGHHTMIALISAEQSASLALHRSLGFVDAGLIREAGFKFDTWLDVAYLQKML